MILYISPFYHPEPISTGKYNTALVNALRERGEETVVVTSYPTYPHWRPEHVEDAPDAGAIVRGGLRVRYPRSPVLRRLVLETWFAAFVARTLLRYRGRVERVVCVLPPSGFVLVVAWMLPRRARRIGIVHDLQGLHARSADSVLRKLVGASVDVIERRVFRRFDRLLFLSESMRDQALRHYGVPESSCRVCYPFVTLSPDAPGDELPDKARVFVPGFRHVVYAGALGEKQNPQALASFMSRLAERDPRIMCHIFSAGPAFEALKGPGGSARADRLRFHGLVDEMHLADLYRSSDVQVIPQASGTGEAALPSKLPNLAAAGVPIVAICDDDAELGRLVRALGGGVCEWCADAFEQAVRGQLARAVADGADRGGTDGSGRGRSAPEAFDIAATLERILEPIE